MYKIRRAVLSDIPKVLELYEHARGIMRSEHNMSQWANGYPDEAILRKDISNNVSYIIDDEQGNCVASFAFIPGEDVTYKKIYEGQWMDDTKPYGTIHRLASGPDSHGIAQTCFDWCYQQIPNLRVDTHADNHIMQHVILKAGFEYCGIIHLLSGDPRLAYQKIKKIK